MPVTPDATICRFCGESLRPGTNFCVSCGKLIRGRSKYIKLVNCTVCGAQIRRGANFCTACGKVMGGRARSSTKAFALLWTDVKGVLIFYLSILACLIPIAWFRSTIGELAQVFTYIGFLTVILIYTSVKKIDLKPLYRLTRDTVRYIGIGLLVLVFIIIFNLLYASAIVELLGINTDDVKQDSDYLKKSLLYLIFTVCLLPALFEEAAFRGLIQTQLNKSLRARDSIILTAVMFEVIHLRFLLFPFIITSFFFCILRYKSKSLWPSMITHFLYNFAVIVYMRYM